MYPGIPCHKLPILRQYLYFLVRGLLFTRELLNQKFTVVEFNSSLRKCMVTIIHWLTVTEICATSFVFFHNPVYTLFFHELSSDFMSNSTGSINEEGTDYSSGVPESTPVVGFLQLDLQVVFLCSFLVDRCSSFCNFSFGYCNVGNSVQVPHRYLSLSHVKTILYVGQGQQINPHQT